MPDFSFDPLDPAFLDDPYPVFRTLRNEHPALWHEELDSWIVSRYADCLEILRGSEIFRSDPRTAGEEVPPAMVSIQTLDGREHQRVQDVLVAALREVDHAAVEGHVVGVLRELAPSWAAQPDFVHDIALPVTTRSTLSVFGLPPDTADRVADASAAIVRSMMHGLLPEGQRAGMRERQLVTDALSEWYGRTDEGLLGALHRMPGAEALDRGTLLNSVRVVLLAGINTTQRMLSLALHALLTHGDGPRQFVEAPHSTRALHELVRFEGSAQSASRYCATPVTLHGKKIGTGQNVIALLGSANRDEARFPDPDTLLLDRHPNPHLGFGRGAHACLGIPLAHTISRAVLEFLATHHPALHAAGPPVMERNPALRGMNALPLALR